MKDICLVRFLNTMLCWCQTTLPQRTFLRLLKSNVDPHRETQHCHCPDCLSRYSQTLHCPHDTVPTKSPRCVIICLICIRLQYSFQIPFVLYGFIAFVPWMVVKWSKRHYWSKDVRQQDTPHCTQEGPNRTAEFSHVTSVQLWAFLLFSCILRFSSY